MKLVRYLVSSLLAVWLTPSSSLGRLSMDVTAGFEGKAMPQSWMPVLIEFFNDGPAVEGFVEVSSPFGSKDVVYGKPVVLPTNSRKRMWLYPYVGSFGAQYQVRLVTPNGRLIAESTAPMDTLLANSQLYVTATRAELNLLPLAAPRASNTSPVCSVRMRPAALPDDPVGYEGLSALVLTEVAESEWTAGQRRALRNWVALGGHLVVSVNHADSFIQSHFWEELLPMRVMGSVVVPSLDGLQGGNVGAAAMPRQETAVAIGEIQRGTVRAKAGDVPLVISTSFGRGKVTLLTFAIEREPFRSWTGKEMFWRTLLPLPTRTAETSQMQNLPQWGTRNLDDVFRALLEARLERQISLWWLLALIGCYLVVIGPFDYWLVRHKLKRPVLTWVTFPCYVVGFSALIYGIGYALKSGDSELVQVSFVDVVPEAGLVRGTTIAGFYSTSNRRYGFEGAGPETHFRFTTRGLESPSASSGFGGGTTVLDTDHGFASSVPVPIWSSKTFVTEWTTPDTALEAKLRKADGSIEIELANHLPVTFAEVLVVANGQVQSLPPLKPHERTTRTIPSSSTKTIAAWLEPFTTFLNRQAPMLGYGFQRFRPEDVPSWNSVLCGFSFLERTRSPNQHFDFSTWRGTDLSQSEANGQIVLLAYADDFPISGLQPRFKPDKTRRHALIRCVLQPSALNPEP